MIDYVYLYNKYKDSNIKIVNEIKSDGTIISYSYKDILKEVERISKILNNKINSNDNCILYLEDGAKFLIYFLTLYKLNSNIIILDKKTSKKEFNYLLNKTKANIIFIDEDYDFKNKFNFIMNVNNEEIIINENINRIKNDSNNAKCIIFSSGTTSNKTGIIHDISDLYEMIKYTNYRYKVKENDSFLSIVPNNHIYGLAVNILFSTFVGTKVYYFKDLNFNLLIKILKENKIDYFCGITKIYEMFENIIKSKIGDNNIKIVNLCFKIRNSLGINIGKLIFKDVFKVFGNMCLMNAGSPISEYTNKFLFGIGFPIIKFYGLTETGVPIISTVNKNKYTYGEGKVLEPSIIKINEETKELYVKNDFLLKGYIGDNNNEILNSILIDGWVNTGDTAKIINNNVYITGRTKDSIVLSNGEKVSPDDIELFYKDLLELVKDYAVCGIKKDNYCDDINIFIVKKDNISELDIKKMISNISKTVSSNMRIKNIYFVDEIPRTNIGKVKRYKLKEIINKI